MSKNTKQQNSSVPIIIIFLIWIIGIPTLVYVFKNKNLIEIKATVISADKMITEREKYHPKDKTGHNVDRQTLSIKYKYNNKTYTKDFVKEIVYEEYTEGQTITVYVNKKKPQNVYLYKRR